MLVDTHCHLQDDKYCHNIYDVISSASQQGVKCCIVNGCNTKTNNDAVFLSEKYGSIFAAVGYHPTEEEDVNIELLSNLLKKHKVVALGEIGLDFYYTRENSDFQISKFIMQLDLAVLYNVPVIIHNRNATDEIIHILENYKGKIRGIIHCFSGSLETAKKFIDLGFLLGVGGIVTFKNCNLKNTLRQIPLSNIVLETDSPYLTPEPFRKYINEPKYVTEIAKFLSLIYDVDLELVSRVTTRNALELFGLVGKID